VGRSRCQVWVVRLTWNMLAIRVEFEASVSEQRATCPEIVCYEPIVRPAI